MRGCHCLGVTVICDDVVVVVDRIFGDDDKDYLVVSRIGLTVV